MTAHLTVLRGLPGSGKSSWARTEPLVHEKTVIVSRDGFRKMASPMGYAPIREWEELITDWERDSVVAALRKGFRVILDATNLRQRKVREWLGLAESEGATWDVKDFTHVSLEACLANNADREDPVPPQYITQQYERFIKGKTQPLPGEWIPVGRSSRPDVEPYVADETKPLALIVDIDGTLAKMNGRGPHEYDRVGEDEPVYPVIKLVDEWQDGAYEDWTFGANDWGESPKVILMSGRPESCRKGTEAWLHAHGILWDHLFMRSDQEQKDGVADDKVKLRLFNEHVRHNYHVRAVLDDRDRVVKMWRALGLTCLQVAEGQF